MIPLRVFDGFVVGDPVYLGDRPVFPISLFPLGFFIISKARQYRASFSIPQEYVVPFDAHVAPMRISGHHNFIISLTLAEVWTSRVS